MIIVSGKIIVSPGSRDSFLHKSLESITAAREAPGCLDFVVAADPIELHRVNVYEAWNSMEDLHAFRGAGPDSGISDLIESAHVAEYVVHSADV